MLSWLGMTVLIAGGAVHAQMLPAIVSAGSDHNIRRFDSTPKQLATVGAHDDTINALVAIPGSGGDVIAAGSADGNLRLWNVKQTRATLEVKSAHSGAILSLAVTPDGKLLASGGSDKRIKIWDVKTGKTLANIEAHSDAVRAIQFTDNGDQLVSASADRTIRFWKVGRKASSVTLEQRTDTIAHDSGVTGLAIAPDGRMFASISSDSYLKTWRMESIDRRVKASERELTAVAFSPDGKTLATGDEDGKIRLWDVSKAAWLPFTASHDRAVLTLAWSDDGKILVSGGEDKTLRYWNTSNGSQVAKLAAHDGAVKALVVVP